MKKLYLVVFSGLVLAALGCSRSPEVLHDLSDKSYPLINEDSSRVQFPADYSGDYLVVSFIYTHCPDICPVTTANMKNAFNMLQDTSDVKFVEISFDPERDTPAVLKNYMQNFELNPQYFSMLTGASAPIDSVLKQMDVQAKVSFSKTDSSGTENYWMNHTDRISIMDRQGRVRFEYPGSKVPPEHIVEDLNKLRGGWF